MGFLTSWCKLNVEIKVCSEVVSGSGAKRLQFRSPRMTTFKSRSNASKRLFARDSKHVVGVCGGRYVLQIKTIFTFCIELLAKDVESHRRRQMINSQAQ